jgi:hypothetical protein
MDALHTDHSEIHAQYVAVIALVAGAAMALLSGSAAAGVVLLVVAVLLLANALWADALLCQREGTILLGADPAAIKAALEQAHLVDSTISVAEAQG